MGGEKDNEWRAADTVLKLQKEQHWKLERREKGENGARLICNLEGPESVPTLVYFAGRDSCDEAKQKATAMPRKKLLLAH